MANNRPIRITDTALGTIWIDCCCEPYTLDLRPWWHGSSRLDGQGLPFFTVTLRRFEGRWALMEFHDHYQPGELEWPHGARDKVPEIVREIGAAWAAAHESYICERATNYLKREVEYLLDGAGIPGLWKAVATAELLDRMDLLKPLQPRIREIFGEFSSVNRKLVSRSSIKHRRAA
jgi:hypothetical protein